MTITIVWHLEIEKSFFEMGTNFHIPFAIGLMKPRKKENTERKEIDNGRSKRSVRKLTMGKEKLQTNKW